jgi:hypothetical protein
VVRVILARRLAHRITVSMSGPRVRPRHDFDVEGSAVDVDGDRIGPPREAP